jgi:hypothetical protein
LKKEKALSRTFEPKAMAGTENSSIIRSFIISNIVAV